MADVTSAAFEQFQHTPMSTAYREVAPDPAASRPAGQDGRADHDPMPLVEDVRALGIIPAPPTTTS